MKIEIPSRIISLAKIFNKNNYSLWVVGGALRDIALGKIPKDWDFATNATPDEMLKLFPNAIKTGIKHSTLTIIYKGGFFETTTFRVDGVYEDKRHPLEIQKTDNIHKDLERRDFTINAFAYNPLTEEFIDDFDGQKDLKKKYIKTVREPEIRFSEDALRLLRAIRFATTLNFKIEEATLKAIIKLKETIINISSERIKAELDKIMSSENSSYGIRLLFEIGLLEYIIPEINNIFKKDKHQYEEVLLKLDNLKNSLKSIKYSLLFEPLSVDYLQSSTITLRKTDEIQKILKRLKFSNEEIKNISFTIKYSHPSVSSFTDKKTIRHYLSLAKKDDGNILQPLEVISCITPKKLLNRIKTIEDISNDKSIPFTYKDLKINGNCLITLGINGEKVGLALEAALNKVLDEPEYNTEEYLTNYIIKLGKF